MAVDGGGNIYIADSGDNKIRKVSANGTISTVAGPGSGPLGDGGPATSASLKGPIDVAVDSAGNIFIADYGNGRIRKVSLDGNIATVAEGAASIGEEVSATSAKLSGPSAVAIDSAGNLYLADSDRICEVSTAGIITTVVGKWDGETIR